MRKTVNIKKVALEAGVAVSTASMALRGNKNIKLQTRLRLREVADRLGYVPNVSAQNLISGKSSCIGVIAMPSNNDYYIKQITQIQQQVLAHNYKFKIFMADLTNLENQTFLLNEIFGLVDGLICPPLEEELNEIFVRKLDNIGIKYIFSKYTQTPNVDWVSVDLYKTGYLATKHLLDQGHTNIATFATVEDSLGFPERLQGYKDAMDEYGMSNNYLITDCGDLLEYKDGYNLTKKLLKLTPRPTALFMRSDFIALTAIRAIVDMGLVPGKDIAIVGMDNMDAGNYSVPSLTTIDCRYEEMAFQLCKTLTSRLKGNQEPAKNIWLEPKLIERESSLINKNQQVSMETVSMS